MPVSRLNRQSVGAEYDRVGDAGILRGFVWGDQVGCWQHACCLVPEKREELTTEGGLDVSGNLKSMQWACDNLKGAGVEVSLFIDPDEAQIDAAAKVGAPVVELHTGCYATAKNPAQQAQELARIRLAGNMHKAQDYKSTRGMV